jgi:hypothetical protein
MYALGGPLSGPAIKALTALTDGVRSVTEPRTRHHHEALTCGSPVALIRRKRTKESP